MDCDLTKVVISEVLIALSGISLQPDQWEKLKNLIGDIDEAIEELKG